MRYLIFTFFLFHLSILFSQNGSSILGNKNSVHINFNYAVPFISGNFKKVNYVEKNDALVLKRNIVNLGLSLSYSRVIKSNIILGCDFKYFQFKTQPISSFNIQYGNGNFVVMDTILIKMNSVKMSTISFLPYLEIYNLKNASPIGIANQFGIGYSVTKIRNGSYAYTSQRQASVNSLTPEIDAFNYEEKSPKYKSITIMYGQKLKYPITKKLIFGIGVNYYLNFFLKNASHNTKYELIDYEDIYFNIKQKQILNIQGNVSLGFMF